MDASVDIEGLGRCGIVLVLVQGELDAAPLGRGHRRSGRHAGQPNEPSR